MHDVRILRGMKNRRLNLSPKSPREVTITRLAKEVERKAGPYVGDPRTVEQKIATVENTLRILRQNPKEAQEREGEVVTLKYLPDTVPSFEEAIARAGIDHVAGWEAPKWMRITYASAPSHNVVEALRVISSSEWHREAVVAARRLGGWRAAEDFVRGLLEGGAS